MNKIIKSVAVVTVIGLSTRALSFLYRIILTRQLTSYELGVYQLTLSFFMVLLTFTSSGVPLAISRRTSQTPLNQHKKVSEIACSGFLLTLVFAIGACFAIICFKNVFSLIFADKRCYDLLIMLLPALVFSCAYSSFRGSLWGRKRFLEYSFVELVEEIVSLVTLILLFYFFKPQIDKIAYPIVAVTMSVVVASIFATVTYIINGGRFKIDASEFAPTLKIASPITFVRVLSSFSSSILSLILPARLVLYGLSQQDAMSLIGLVSGVAFPLLFVPSSLISSIALVLVPEIAEDMAKKKKVEWKIQKAFTFVVIVASLVVPIYFVLGNEICSIIFDKPEASKYLIASTIAIIPMGLNQLAVSFLNSAGGEKYGFTNFLIGVTVAVATVVFLTPYISIYANIISMILQPTIIFILNLFRMSKIMKVQKRKLLKNISFAFTIIPTCVVGFCVKSISINLPLVSHTILTGLAIAVFFLLAVFSLTQLKTKEA